MNMKFKTVYLNICAAIVGSLILSPDRKTELDLFGCL